MTNKQREAKIEALNEAAGHLEMSWTDNDEERRQGNVVAAELRRRADRLSLSSKDETQHWTKQ